MKNEAISSVAPEIPVAPFFRRLDWAAFWTALAVSFGVYFYSLAPSTTLEDAGELATAGAFMGVPHPPGYPLWSMLSFLFSQAFSWVKYMGQPNPAWSISLVSATFGAIATGLTAMLICRSATDLLAHSKITPEPVDDPTANLFSWTGGVVGSLLFAFSPVMWSQAVICEVYSLNAFFLALIFLLVYWWTRRPSNPLLYAIAFVFGLSLTNYYALLLAVLALAIIIFLKDAELFRDFAIMGIAFLVTIAIINIASEPPEPGRWLQPADADAAKLGFSGALLPVGRYIGLAFCVALIVIGCIVMRFTQRSDEWPVAPSIMMTVGAIGAVLLLAAIPNPTVGPPILPGVAPFPWLKYTAGFLLAMGVLIALCASFRRGYLVAIALIAINLTLAVLLKKGALHSLMQPQSGWFQFYVALNFVYLALAFILLPRGRAVAWTILASQIGVSFYIYMPLVSDLRNPPMNWGYPRTWEGFKHAVTRGQYERLIPTEVFSFSFVKQCGDYVNDLREQFTIPMALLGFLPFAAWQVRVMGRRINALYVAIAFAIPAAVLVLAEEIFRLEHLAKLGFVYWTLGAVVILLLCAGGLTTGVRQVREMIQRLTAGARTSTSEKVVMALALGGIALGLIFLEYKLAFKFIEVTEPIRRSTVQAPLAPDQYSFLFWQATGLIALLLAIPLSIGGVTWFMAHPEYELNMTLDDNATKWLIATFIGYLSMSVVMMVLANPKGDIQDAFIQRVKFISSHAIYSFWIGYGLVFGLTVAYSVLKKNVMLKWLSVAAALLFSGIPIYMNYYNKELIRRSGSADQTLHDFGWQFGNYQLRGSEAILEELSPNEEPLPNPEFPREMGPDAIFYGGTDPGRFVPTYMIYSAKVREDVYLITQNALADSTYMAVMRDLYGDRIWIPAMPDSAKAFQRYVEEVQSGKRPQNADLKIENGRVQVSGALGVMEINGILAEMIFEHNKFKHDFFVEESYVIRWMYPYLSPHGLIMKINPTPRPLTPDDVRDDTDFWDWYVRRFMHDEKFIRDVVARKSFSKLRSAIAGLYGAHGRFTEAERAYQQARILYPLSPEANFRLAQEIFMSMQRFKDARELIEEFGTLDPDNPSVPSFVNQVRHFENIQKQINDIETKNTAGQLEVGSALQLLECYAQLGRTDRVGQLSTFLLANTNMPPVVYYRIAALMARLGRWEDTARATELCSGRMPPEATADNFMEMIKWSMQAKRVDLVPPLLSRYLQLRPDDWKAWLDMALISMELNQSNNAVRALNEARKFGGPQADQIVFSDPKFAPLRPKLGPPRNPSSPFQLPSGIQLR